VGGRGGEEVAGGNSPPPEREVRAWGWG
jgi:hypothetical protein